MGEKVLIVKPIITHIERAWIRNINKKNTITKKIKIKKVTFIVKLSPSETIRLKKINKRIYDLDYYWKHKNEINIRQRQTYLWRKNNTKFI